MKTYSYKREGHWDSSDYPPFDFQWQPARRKTWGLLGKVAEWLFFFAGCFASSWAIYMGLKAIWPGLGA